MQRVWTKITAFTADPTVARKRLVSRTTRYSGLLDLLTFEEGNPTDTEVRHHHHHHQHPHRDHGSGDKIVILVSGKWWVSRTTRYSGLLDLLTFEEGNPTDTEVRGDDDDDDGL
jgi:hypothetical protein